MLTRSPISRRADPASSHAAAAEIMRSGQRDTQCAAVLSFVIQHPEMTSAELARFAEGLWQSNLSRYVFARRLPELEDRGLVRKGKIRQCSVGKRMAVTWEPVWRAPVQVKFL